MGKPTNIYYYGARYYNPRWSSLSASGGWLSVDPLADKYPHASPYNYCLNNPVIFVDPDGMEIEITGEDAKEAVAQIQNTTKNLKTVYNEETNRLTFTGEAKTKYEKALVKASESKDYLLKFETSKLDYVPGLKVSFFVGGSFLGAEKNENSNQIEISYLINVDALKKMDQITRQNPEKYFGSNFGHELIESFIIGETMVKENLNTMPMSTSSSPNRLFNKAHNKTAKYGVGQRFELEHLEYDRGNAFLHYRGKKHHINPKGR